MSLGFRVWVATSKRTLNGAPRPGLKTRVYRSHTGFERLAGTAEAVPSQNLSCDTDSSGVAPALDAASFCRPVHEPLHVLAVFPRQVEELARGHVIRFFSKKRFKPPAHIGALPRFQSIASGRIPVVPERLKHVRAQRAYRSALSV